MKAPFKHDFIELYNPTNEDVTLDDFSLTYTNNSGKTIQTFEFNENHVIKANDYFLLRGEATLGNNEIKALVKYLKQMFISILLMLELG